jgi:hypothetical protein
VSSQSFLGCIFRLQLSCPCCNENVFTIHFGGKVELDRTDNIIWYILLPKRRSEGRCMRLKARVPADLRSSEALGLEGWDGVEAYWRGGHLQGPPAHEGPSGDLGKGRGNSMRANPLRRTSIPQYTSPTQILPSSRRSICSQC